ncbi:MAG: hypothetical protein HXY34_04805 [Candidatus Thorarchaeota archaeon]|nr:hypothetical protein [Candidatus Thorarchaeota archaeon]
MKKGTALLADVFRRLDLRATFHIQEQADPNLKISLRYPSIVDALSDEGYEIGLHSHITSTDSKVRYDEISSGASSLCDAGHRVRVFRAGWYFTTTSTINVLERLQIDYDCSPVKNSRVANMRWYDLPDSPYFPSTHDVTRRGSSSVLVIPVTNYRLCLNYWPNQAGERQTAEKAMIRGLKYLGDLSRVMDRPVIAYVTTHSWKPVTENGESIRGWVVERFDKLAAVLSEYEYESFSVSEMGDRWKGLSIEPYWLDAPDVLGSILGWRSPRKHYRLVRSIGSRILALRYRLTGHL